MLLKIHTCCSFNTCEQQHTEGPDAQNKEQPPTPPGGHTVNPSLMTPSGHSPLELEEGQRKNNRRKTKLKYFIQTGRIVGQKQLKNQNTGKI